MNITPILVRSLDVYIEFKLWTRGKKLVPNKNSSTCNILVYQDRVEISRVLVLCLHKENRRKCWSKDRDCRQPPCSRCDSTLPAPAPLSPLYSWPSSTLTPVLLALLHSHPCTLGPPPLSPLYSWPSSTLSPVLLALLHSHPCTLGPPPLSPLLLALLHSHLCTLGPPQLLPLLSWPSSTLTPVLLALLCSYPCSLGPPSISSLLLPLYSWPSSTLTPVLLALLHSHPCTLGPPPLSPLYSWPSSTLPSTLGPPPLSPLYSWPSSALTPALLALLHSPLYSWPSSTLIPVLLALLHSHPCTLGPPPLSPLYSWPSSTLTLVLLALLHSHPCTLGPPPLSPLYSWPSFNLIPALTPVLLAVHSHPCTRPSTLTPVLLALLHSPHPPLLLALLHSHPCTLGPPPLSPLYSWPSSTLSLLYSCSCSLTPSPVSDRLVGLVVRHPPRERKIPSSNPVCAGIFSGLSHTSDFKICTPVATLPGSWCYRVSAGTGPPGVSILWLGEMESWICNFYLSVSARKIEQICPRDTLACCWDVKQPTNNNSSLIPALTPPSLSPLQPLTAK